MPSKAGAADTSLTNGITVDSILDTPDSNIGDGNCDDGDGNCTLRAAIQEANYDPDVSTILFNITGPGVHTIQPGSSLPPITEEVNINGYSQPGAHANTAPAPQPLNGSLLIEIDGGGTSAALPEIRADNSTVRGLVINNSVGTGVVIGGNNIGIYGNYIGTDPTGLLEKPNALNGINGGTIGFQDGDNALIGSANPADRNVISGNENAGVTPNTGNDGWVVKGNYIGMGSDGVTTLPNSFPVNGPGGLSIDNCAGTLVGGPEEGATNVISGNGSFGLFPDNTNGLTIQGNIIGPDWKGDPVVGSAQQGGIGLPPVNGPFNNTLIGGTNPGEGNLIAYNRGTGIAIVALSFGVTPIGVAEKVSVLGNSIYSNDATPGYILSESGMGIDLLSADMQAVASTTTGPTPNDSNDSDSGPNGFINSPILNSASQTGDRASINFNLDASDSTNGQYRVEFFANDAQDPSGYGEGQTFLGAVTSQNGNNQQISLALRSGYSLSGKFVSATTTAIDNTTASGFGGTSEFSPVVRLEKNSNKVSLAGTGENINLILLIIVAATTVSSTELIRRFKP